MKEFMKYKLEAYQKYFPNFIYGSPTSRDVLGQDEETKAGPSGIIYEEEGQTKESHDLRIGITYEEDVQPKIP